jgi:hypothetical protein
MDNQRMGNYQTQVTSTSPRMSKVTIAKIRKQPFGIKVA